MDGGDGDGYTAQSATGSLEEAYSALVEHANLSVSGSEGTIVICGPTTVNKQFNNDGSIEHAGTVIFTSVCNGTDYRDNGAALVLCAASKGDLGGNEQRFLLGGPAIFRDITIDRNNSSVHETIYAPVSLVMEESVEVVNGYWKQDGTLPDWTGLSDEEISSIILSAHRGWQPAGPENSYVSFEAAGQLGFYAIETDAHLTKDNYLVCIHDGTIDRTFNGTGTVEEMTLEELRQYRMDILPKYYTGDKRIEDFSDHDRQIPLFSEYLDICKKYGSIPFIELKSSALEGERLEYYIQKVLDEAHAAGFTDEEIVISSGSPEDLAITRRLNNKVFLHDIWVAGVDFMKDLITDGSDYRDSNAGLAFNQSNLKGETNYNAAKAKIEQAHEAGLQACLRAGDGMETVRTMLELGVDYMFIRKTSLSTRVDLKYVIYHIRHR